MIHVLSPGLLTTVQDLGRFGWAQYGISASGAADPLAFRAANLLCVGNPDNLPALEMTLAGPDLLFESPAIIAITGANFASNPPLWEPIEISRRTDGPAAPRAYRSASLPRDPEAAWTCRAVMGSASVHVMTGVGGRPLRKGDTLAIGNAAVRRPRPPARNAPAFTGTATLCV